MTTPGADAARSDVLAGVLDTLRLRGRIFCRSELSAPWGMRLRPSPFAHFHVIERGGAWLRLSNRTPIALGPGDLVLVPRGAGHELVDAPDSRALSLQAMKGDRTEGGGHTVIRSAGQGPVTEFFCGSFQFETSDGHPLLALLPEVVHVRSTDERAAWLQLTQRALQLETRERRPGAETVVSRLLDVMFIEALRVWIAGLGEAEGGWLGALRDPQVGAALAAIHSRPGEPWTIESLAREAGQSRSVFAERFTRLVGEPPLTYLTGWRMTQAAAHLRDRGLALGEVAERVGYESEASFSKAFKRRRGLSPGAFRRAARDQGDATRSA